MEKVLDRLIEILLQETDERCCLDIDATQKADLFRSLCNQRPPMAVTDEFLRLEKKYLTHCTNMRGVVSVESFIYDNNITLYQGDITRLDADAIVNACNSALLGCFVPLHNCIDNIIHSCAGVSVRLDCDKIMKSQNEKNGSVKMTSGYNLPSKYIFHTVGPIVYGSVSQQNQVDLASCYISCLDLAQKMGLSSIAFCCISTGVYGYPKDQACTQAIKTVKEWQSKNAKSKLKIIFNVFTDEDTQLYKAMLG